MDFKLIQTNAEVYDRCNLEISDFKAEIESKDYDACQFTLNGLKIISRSAKTTPKKAGQFVTFWKRIESGSIEPFHETDDIDFYVVNVQNDDLFGQFVFPKTILIKKGIISTANKEGKRAFRVYPIWDMVQNRQAAQTKKWQLDYFYLINEDIDFQKVLRLYGSV